VKIEGHGPDILCVPGSDTDVLYGVLIDLIDRHVKTDIVRRGLADILKYEIVSIPADGIVPLAVPVQAQQDQVCLRQVYGKCAVGDHIDDQIAHLFRLHHQIPQGFLAVFPQKSLPAAEEEDADEDADDESEESGDTEDTENDALDDETEDGSASDTVPTDNSADPAADETGADVTNQPDNSATDGSQTDGNPAADPAADGNAESDVVN